MGPIQTTVGIQITDSVLRIAVIQSRFGRFRLVRSDEILGFAELSEEGRKDALTALVHKHGLRRARAFLTVPRRMGVCRNIELPVEVGDRVGSAVALQIESLSPWSAEEVYWDYAVERPGKGDRTLLVSVAIIPRSALDSLLATFTSAGLPLAGAGLSSMADAHAWILFKKEAVEEAREFVFSRHRDGEDSQTPISLPIEGAASLSPLSFGAVVAGLLGFGRSAFNVNVLPATDRFRTNHLRLIPTYVLASAVVLLGITSLVRTPYQWRQYEAALDSEIAALRPAVNEVASQEEKLTQATAAYQVLKARVETHDPNLEALLELARLLPPDSWISSYNSQGRTVTLSGFAQSASEVQKILEQSPLFEDVQLSSALTRDASGKDRFNLKATVGVAP